MVMVMWTRNEVTIKRYIASFRHEEGNRKVDQANSSGTVTGQ